LSSHNFESKKECRKFYISSNNFLVLQEEYIFLHAHVNLTASHPLHLHIMLLSVLTVKLLICAHVLIGNTMITMKYILLLLNTR